MRAAETPTVPSRFGLLRSRVSAVLAAALAKFQADEASLRAMGLTYTTILSLVPFLAVTFSLLKAFGVQNQIEPLLDRALSPLGTEAGDVSRKIVEFVDHLEVGVLGTLGVAGLLYTVISLVGTVESSLNQVWNVRMGRAWSDKVRDYLTVVLVGPVMLFTALALTASAQSNFIVRRVLDLAPSVTVILTGILPYLMLIAAFTMLYRFLPNTRVTWSAAFAGGIVAGIGWKLAGTAFAAFVVGSGSYAAIYSSFAILLLFLIWIYVSWLIVLVGSEVAYLVQHFDVMTIEDSRGSIDRERKGLKLLVLLAERQLAGERPAQHEELARRLQIRVDELDDLVQRFVERGILLISSEPQGIALARPPELVPVAEALEAASAAEEPPPGVPLEPVSELLRRKQEAGLRAVEGTTLREIVPAASRAAGGAPAHSLHRAHSEP